LIEYGFIVGKKIKEKKKAAKPKNKIKKEATKKTVKSKIQTPPSEKKKSSAELEKEADALLKAVSKGLHKSIDEINIDPLRIHNQVTTEAIVLLETPNYYFGKNEEENFLKYIRSTDQHERDLLYNKWLKNPFQKMVESILRRYPVHIGNYTMEEVEQNGLSHLIENMSKFQPEKLNKEGKKVRAFSYCQTIVRNYYRDHGKRSYSEKTSNLNYEDFSGEIENMDEYMYEIDYSDDSEIQELMNSTLGRLRDKIDNDKSLRKNEIIVGEAIINVLEHWDILFMEETRQGKYNKRVTNNYTKNKILLLLKEQTRLSTKDIRASMKQFKELYFINKKMFYSDVDE
jgi:hypothetical protein